MSNGTKIKRLGALAGAVAVGASALSVAPVTNVVSAEHQPVAEAAAVSRVHNWRYSDKPVKVYENRYGNGDWKWIHPGETVVRIGDDWRTAAHPESIRIPGRCRTEIDPAIGPSKFFDRRGKSGVTYNFPLRMLAQGVIVEVNC